MGCSWVALVVLVGWYGATPQMTGLEVLTHRHTCSFGCRLAPLGLPLPSSQLAVPGSGLVPRRGIYSRALETSLGPFGAREYQEEEWVMALLVPVPQA